jgi:septal ring factor EnvC (AmiA/AmiB activator)
VSWRDLARLGVLGMIGWLTALAAGPAAAQSAGDTTSLARQIQESQQRLERIRAERSRLQTEMLNTRALVEDVSVELRNVERRLSASRGILAELELQAEVMALQVERSSGELLRTREGLRESEAVLNRRLRDIYKLGPLHSVRVLLAAESFSDMLTRYRYLRLMANYDRGLVIRVGELERALALQNEELQRSLQELGNLREAKLGEVVELRSVEQDRQATLNRYRAAERQTRSRLTELEEDLTRLTELMLELEDRRVEEERAVTAGPNRMAVGDAGVLDWPVDGEVLYNFGPQRQPNGTVLRWNGLGIQAPVGTPVRAVRGGRVVLAGPFEGYGPTVILSHGNGFYTLYLYLEEVGVVEGREVEAGQVVGTVGGASTPEGPHIEFQIRAPTEGSTPLAQDPLEWLRPRGDA